MKTIDECLQDLPTRLKQVYDECIQAKDVLYYPSEVTREDNELKTEIRLCESLSKKPGPTPSQLASSANSQPASGRGSPQPPSVAEAAQIAKAKEQEREKKQRDVFAPENWDSLLIDQFDGQQGEEYGLLLNKFAVVPLHFLLVTKHWEAQTSPLTPPQLLAAYHIIRGFYEAPRKAGSAAGELLGFFNCGMQSGASQEHKHVQFAPMHGEGSIGHFPTERAAESIALSEQDQKKPFYLPSVPYAHHVRRINLQSVSASADAAQVMRHLAEVYLSLLDAMIDNLRSLAETERSTGREETEIPTRLGKGLSYNLLLTRKHMHMIPRREAVYRLPEPTSAHGLSAATTEPTIIGCNALAFTGTVLVKSTGDAKRLKEEGGVLAALKACAYPRAEDEIAGVHEDA